MATASQILQRYADMQRSAQQNLPVAPNNGNPGTVYNTNATPNQPAPVPQGPAARPFLPRGNAVLQRLREQAQARIYQSAQANGVGPVVPQQTTPQPPASRPVMPMRIA